MKSATAKPKNIWKASWIIGSIFVGIFAFLFLFRAQTQSGDSLFYATAAQSGQGLFHPHHLIFNIMIRLFHQAGKALGLTWDTVLAGQIHNILWAIVAALAIYFLVKNLLRSRVWGLLAVSALVLSRGFWEFATQNEVYIPAMACSALVLLIGLHKPAVPASPKRMLGMVLFFSLAVFYHQSIVLFLLPLAVFIITSDKRNHRLDFLKFAVLSGVIIIGGYIFGCLASGGQGGLKGLIDYCLDYIHNPNPTWSSWSNVSLKSVGLIFLGQMREIVNIPFRFFIPAGIIMAGIMASLFIWHVRWIVRRENNAPLRLLCLIWWTVNFVFLLWWDPRARELLVIPLFPFWLLVFLLIRDMLIEKGNEVHPGIWTGGPAVAFGLIVALIGVTNYIQVITPLRASRGFYHEEAGQVDSCSPPDTMILASTWETEQNLRYYFGRKQTDEIDLRMLTIYRHLSRKPDFALDPRKSVVAALVHLNPAVNFFSYSGYSHPREWIDVLSWLFDLEFDSQNKPIGGRHFRIFPCRADYLLLSPERTALDGWGDLFGRLDTEIARAGGDSSQPYSRWFEDARKKGLL